MGEPLPNLLMVSADRSVVAGERGPFYYMLELFSRHWGRVDVIGTRPERVAATTVFGNVHLHHPSSGKLRQAGFITNTGVALARERDYALITSHDYNPFYNGWGASRISHRTGIPFVSEIHHVPGFPRAANLRERLDRWATRRYVRWARSRAAGFRVVNGTELPALLGRWGVASTQIHVLPSLYLDREVFRPADVTPRPESDLLFVGRLVPNKGLLAILDALRLGREQFGSRWRLRVLGRGPESARMEAFLARHRLQDQVERLEWVADAPALAQLYRASRLLVCASLSEGGPRVVPEAMACGTPAVSTRVGLVPDILTDRVNGRLFDGSAADLARVLHEVLDVAGAEAGLRSELPPRDFQRYERSRVLAELAEGLLTMARTPLR